MTKEESKKAEETKSEKTSTDDSGNKTSNSSNKTAKDNSSKSKKSSTSSSNKSTKNSSSSSKKSNSSSSSKSNSSSSNKTNSNSSSSTGGSTSSSSSSTTQTHVHNWVKKSKQEKGTRNEPIYVTAARCDTHNIEFNSADEWWAHVKEMWAIDINNVCEGGAYDKIVGYQDVPYYYTVTWCECSCGATKEC